MNLWEQLTSLRARANATEKVIHDMLVEAAGPAGTNTDGKLLVHWVELEYGPRSASLRNSRETWTPAEVARLRSVADEVGVGTVEVYDSKGRWVCRA